MTFDQKVAGASHCRGGRFFLGKENLLLFPHSTQVYKWVPGSAGGYSSDRLASCPGGGSPPVSLKWQISIVLFAQQKMHGTVTAIYGMKKDTPLVEFYRFKPDSTAIAKTGANNVSLSVTFDPENWLAQTLQVFSQRGSPRHDSQACTVSWRTLASDSVHSS